MNDLKIPVGVSDFAKIRNYKYYYVDKTGLIEDLLEKDGRSHPHHPPPPVWKDHGHEHAGQLF